jgi:hypothetical protein
VRRVLIFFVTKNNLALLAAFLEDGPLAYIKDEGTPMKKARFLLLLHPNRFL